MSVSPGAKALPLPTVGILGGGQLGRMIATAAAEMGFCSHIFCQRGDEPATQVATTTTIAPWDDHSALLAFAQACDVVTLEFENIPLATLRFLEEHAVVAPGSAVLNIAQHRGREKRACANAGIETAAFIVVDSPQALAHAVATFGHEVVIKTTRFGYDGKGQVRVREGDAFDALNVWETLLGERASLSGSQPGDPPEHVDPGDGPVIVEQCVPFSCEISVIAARSTSGAVAVFPPALNHHEEGILRTSTVPAGIHPQLEEKAIEIGRTLVAAFDVVGLLAVELFVVGDANSPTATLLVNEVAPRPHNSGHWSQDGSATSQFTQLVRAVADLPLGCPLATSPTTMINLIGADIESLDSHWNTPNAAVHVYGKAQARPGRKMGHVNVRHLSPSQ